MLLRSGRILDHRIDFDYASREWRKNKVYLGLGINGEEFSPSISDIVLENDPDLNKKILILFNNTMDEINDITVPFDKMLSEPHNSAGKQAAENTVSNLLLLAENFKDAGKILDWRVIIAE